MSRRRPFGRWKQFARLCRYRLIVPIQRSRHPVEYTARGSLVGLAWAMTPLVGIQMYLVLMTWAAVRRSPRLDFNPIVACAWTWTTNIFTMLPTYYAFYVTGQAMLGRWTDLHGYDAFVAVWQRAFGDDGWGLSSLGLYVKLLAADQGLTMMLGCVPYAAVCGFLGYRWTLGLLRRRAARRNARKPAAALHAASA